MEREKSDFGGGPYDGGAADGFAQGAVTDSGHAIVVIVQGGHHNGRNLDRIRGLIRPDVASVSANGVGIGGEFDGTLASALVRAQVVTEGSEAAFTDKGRCRLVHTGVPQKEGGGGLSEEIAFCAKLKLREG
jgi:hypothetical protein